MAMRRKLLRRESLATDCCEACRAHGGWSKMKSNRKFQSTAVSLAVALALGSGAAQAISQSGEKQNMNRLGHTDLQGRPSYQPNVIQYPDGRTMLFVGMHSGSPRPSPACGNSNNTLPNPLKGGACENNGTMIIDVTDPRN